MLTDMGQSLELLLPDQCNIFRTTSVTFEFLFYYFTEAMADVKRHLETLLTPIWMVVVTFGIT